MNKKLTPYIFLTVLIVVLFFILGFRSGQQVEKTNKMITALISIAPTATLAPTPPLLSLEKYESPGCKLSFLYPNYFTIQRESSSGAMLVYRTQSINFSCEAFQEQGKDTKELKIWTKTNPNTGKKVVFYLDPSFLPLLEKTLTFSSK
ncbi:hypothetical protein COY90_05345 [Candidatus Roizmanbacteria bacterium CG_4_10_14_0_8_um_filter_39_9]|uniref:Uncharacterized protein n=1 Tax=Candidatus Roizmanbacteria bacterium CG_4_10_14_0_8_um_filter_39_9 TaxID=1974829 RepID=A0A2M7QBE8_9BACT|nr:MAG: hypothetical protein COY90_05345 [Candidatus Roizmanbacteria bacterium CG_4_10_14_0_8_um_filter_39_9]